MLKVAVSTEGERIKTLTKEAAIYVAPSKDFVERATAETDDCKSKQIEYGISPK